MSQIRRAGVVLLLGTLPCLGAGDAASGRELFRNCAGCHDTESDQRKMGPSLRSLFGRVTLRSGRHADDENVRAIILEGLNGMPSFRYSFRPAEIDDLMAYLHTLTGKPAAVESNAGAAYFKAYCVRCHNPDSRTSVGPDLRGRYRDEWVKLVNAGHAGAPPLKDWLDTPGRQALVEFLKKN